MVKTSTSQNPVHLSNSTPASDSTEATQVEDELFYNSIKPQLNRLIKEPSEATMERVLAYAIRK